ncbi:MAG: hypothetical protein IT270_09660 [Saprospiraceae bacterium]|nr:hypothetical protein [Saprospiraceae bacterium]
MVNKSLKKKLLIVFSALVVILGVASIFIYVNFNHLLSTALTKNFNSNILAGVYELKFEKLRVNLMQGSIQVYNVTLMPRQDSVRLYPYINSTVKFKTNKLALKNVDLLKLVRLSELNVGSIEIESPDVAIELAGKRNIFLPFADTTKTDSTKTEEKIKLLSFLLQKLVLSKATVHVVNFHQERSYEIQNFNVNVYELNIDQSSGENLMAYKKVEMLMGACQAKFKKGAFQDLEFKDFSINVDSIEVHNTMDTTMFQFSEFTAGLNKLDVLTMDSSYNFSLDSFKLSYRDKTIDLAKGEAKLNISKAAMQSKFNFQQAQFSGTVGKINLVNVHFDSLIYHNAIRVDELLISGVQSAVFKDKTKPINVNRIPPYFGQQIASISIPVLVKTLKISNFNVVSTEKKKDGNMAKATVSRGTIRVENITNLTPNQPLVIRGEAYLENKVHFYLTMSYSYKLPQYSFDGRFDKFDVTDLNRLLTDFAPAAVKGGKIDEIHFWGTAFYTRASGTMKFLFHDLDVDLDLAKQGDWTNSILSFAANNFLLRDNPAMDNLPPRIVQFDAERDMHKGFINILLRSAFDGLKETIIMSKDNKKDYRKAKKEARKEDKEEKKEEKEEKKNEEKKKE